MSALGGAVVEMGSATETDPDEVGVEGVREVAEAAELGIAEESVGVRRCEKAAE